MKYQNIGFLLFIICGILGVLLLTINDYTPFIPEAVPIVMALGSPFFFIGGMIIDLGRL
jgi:hypothetical protein